jgi:TolA-binding protein
MTIQHLCSHLPGTAACAGRRAPRHAHPVARRTRLLGATLGAALLTLLVPPGLHAQSASIRIQAGRAATASSASASATAPASAASAAPMASVTMASVMMAREGSPARFASIDGERWRDADAIVPLATRTPWSHDQVADSLYRQARERMNRGDYKRAAELFMEVTRRAGKAPLAGDALYWNAYSLYRDGATPALADALAALERLGRDFPTLAIAGDANALKMRVCGELARRGDAQCAAEVASSAGGRDTRVTVAPTPRTPPVPRTPRAPPVSRGRDGAQEPGCPDEDDDERIAALNALMQMDADRALPILEKVLARRDRCSVSLRRKAIFLVSQKHDARAADLLMGAVRNDPDAEVREQAVFWLGQTRDERAVDMLQEILQKESNDEVLEKAVFALSQHKSERAGTILRDLAQRNGAPLKVREQAIFWLGQQRSADNAELLKALYKRVSEPELREKIIFSISQNRASSNARWLLDIALDDKESIEMRKQALFWAGQSRGLSMDDLGALYQRVPDREMKEQVIFVYSQRRDPASVDKLMEIARTEKDRELRKKAIFWLSQSRDPRVIKFLEELIG